MLVFCLFALLIGTLVYKSMNTKYELVTKDYYKDELKYQDRIDAEKASGKISDISVIQENDSIKVIFPKELASSITNGDIWFYCKTDEVKDRHINFKNIADNSFAVATATLRKANYQAKISYKTNNNSYYSEKEIIVH